MINNFEKRDAFFKFLEGNNLLPQSFIEYSPSVYMSLSMLLVSKYKDLYKHYLVSRNFEYKNNYGVHGVRGSLYLDKGKLKVEVLKSNLNDRYLMKGKNGQYITNERGIDTLLIQGCYDEVSALFMTKANILIGDVYDKEEKEVSLFYESIYKYLVNNGIKSTIIKERDKNYEYTLVKHI